MGHNLFSITYYNNDIIFQQVMSPSPRAWQTPTRIDHPQDDLNNWQHSRNDGLPLSAEEDEPELQRTLTGETPTLEKDPYAAPGDRLREGMSSTHENVEERLVGNPEALTQPLFLAQRETSNTTLQLLTPEEVDVLNRCHRREREILEQCAQLQVKLEQELLQ